MTAPVIVGNIEWIASSFPDAERNRASLDASRTWRAKWSCGDVPGCMLILRTAGRLYWRCVNMEIAG